MTEPCLTNAFFLIGETMLGDIGGVDRGDITGVDVVPLESIELHFETENIFTAIRLAILKTAS